MNMALFLKHLLPSLSKPSRSSFFNSVLKKTSQIKLGNRSKFTSNKKSAVSQQPLAKESLSADFPLLPNFKVGDRLSGFIVKEVETIPEFQLTAVKLVHEATGGEYLHIDRNDSNNAFSVMFRTTPTNSTGLPHILEHTTLCGSAKFPCRDPFFKMLNRSLATFMNALTAPDYTMYPFSTQNSVDFENLMSVYLDAVFQPKLKESDFRQEGWRLEHENPEDPTTPIIFKGVVYNEMKGVFADNQNIFQYALQNNMLPSHTYGVCSGGDPLVIPSLTYQDLINFHRNYYSPLNTKYYTYGNFPLEKHLKFINEQYLQNSMIKAKDKLSTVVPPEKKWKQPVRKHITCRIDPLAADKHKQSSIAISVLCCSITNIEECFALKVLSELMVSGPNSSFYKTLIEPNIGAGFSPVTGYESQTRDTMFTVGLLGVSENDFEKVISLYEETIDSIIVKGFEQNHLEAVLHSIELNLKHQTSDFGLGILFSIASIWNHDGDVVNYLKIEKHIENLKNNIAKDPEYLQGIVKKYFKNNSHKLILTMSPDPNYSEEEKRKEEELLKEKIKDLTEDDKRRIFEDGLKLLEEQKKDDKSCLPTLKISDLKKDIEKTEIIEEKIDGVSVLMIPQPTNGVSYFRGLLPFGNLPSELKSYLPLFALISTKMGSKKRDYKEFDQLATLKTGGLNVGTHFKDDPKNMNRIEECLSISSFCLNRNLSSMFDLWLEMFQDMELKDTKRFETLVNAHAASLVNGVTDMGHYYAMLSAGSLVSASTSLKEKAAGMTYVNFMKNIAQGNAEEVLQKMVEIRNVVMTRSRLRCANNILEGTQLEVFEHISKFIKNTPGVVEEYSDFKNISLSETSTKGLFHVLPIPVSYTSKAVVTVPYEHDDFSALAVMARLITMKHLHPVIREKGGAYGGGLKLSNTGLLSFYSYRDPNPANSHVVYDNVMEWLKKGEFTQDDVDEAKLGIFQSIDAPISPGDKGIRWFLHGVTDDSVQRHRLRTMKVTKEKVLEVGEKYLGEKNSNPAGRAVIGPENKAVTENSSQNWKVLVQEK